MHALIALLTALLSLPFRAAYFGRAYQLLPDKVRLTSFGFISITTLYFGSSLLRHSGTAGHEFGPILAGLTFVSFVLLYLFGRGRATELTLYFATSAGVDLSIAGLGVLGLDIGANSVRHPAMAWEIAATVFAITCYYRARRRPARAED